MPFKLLLLFRALRAGESLAKVATWKQRQLRLNALGSVVGILVNFLPVDLVPDDVDAVVTGLSIVGGALVNGYLTLATTTKIGFFRGQGDLDTADREGIKTIHGGMQVLDPVSGKVMNVSRGGES
jgi:hypothetical protein